MAGSSRARRGVPSSLKKAPMTMFSFWAMAPFSRLAMSRSTMTPTMSTSMGRKARSIHR